MTMALNKELLKNNLRDMFSSRPKGDDEAAEKLAEIIFNFVKSAEVTITALPAEISVAGSATAQANVDAITLKGGDSTHSGGLS